MTIRAETADGQVHEFPDGTDQGVIDKAMADYSASMPFAARHPWLDTAADVAKSTMNLGKGVVGATIGLPGDMADLLNTGIEAAAAHIPQFLGGPRDIGGHSDAFTTDEIVRELGIPTYQPHTTAGKFTSSIAEMAPSFLVPEELLLNEVRVAGKTAAGAARQARPAKRGVEAFKEGAGGRAAQGVAAGTGAEAVGELTEDDQGNQSAIGRLIGGGAGGFGAGANTVRRTAKAGRQALQSSEAAAKKSYDFLANSQHPIAPMETSMLGHTIEINLWQDGFRPGTAPQTFEIVRDVSLRSTLVVP